MRSRTPMALCAVRVANRAVRLDGRSLEERAERLAAFEEETD